MISYTELLCWNYSFIFNFTTLGGGAYYISEQTIFSLALLEFNIET